MTMNNTTTITTTTTVKPVRRAKVVKHKPAEMPELASLEKKGELHRQFSSNVPGARAGGNRYRDLGGFDKTLLVKRLQARQGMVLAEKHMPWYD